MDFPEGHHIGGHQVPGVLLSYGLPGGLLPGLGDLGYKPLWRSNLSRINDELLTTAWHEAGHALVGFLYFGNSGQVTILRTATTLGSQHTERFTASLPAFIDAMPPVFRVDLLNKHVQYCLAGRAAESVLSGRVTRRYVGEDAVEALRFVEMAGYSLLGRLYLDLQWTRVRRWLMKHRKQLSRFAQVLLKRRTLEGEEVRNLILRLPPLHEPAPSRELRAEVERMKKQYLQRQEKGAAPHAFFQGGKRRRDRRPRLSQR